MQKYISFRKDNSCGCANVVSNLGRYSSHPLIWGAEMDLAEKTIDSNEAFSGRLLKLRVDKVELPNGRITTREIIVHRGAVAAVPMIDADNVILIRQFRHAAGEALLEIPAGTLEVGETPVDCVHRELHEEIGYRSHRMTPMFSSYLAPGYSSEMLHTFLAEDLEKMPTQKLEEDEFIELVEVPLEKAIDMITQGRIKDAKSICGLLMAQRMLQIQK